MGIKVACSASVDPHHAGTSYMYYGLNISLFSEMRPNSWAPILKHSGLGDFHTVGSWCGRTMVGTEDKDRWTQDMCLPPYLLCANIAWDPEASLKTASRICAQECPSHTQQRPSEKNSLAQWGQVTFPCAGLQA
jgi:hypothetical protein